MIRVIRSIFVNYIAKRIELALFKIKWKRYNGHNFTYPVNLFSMARVTVGKMSYGPLNVETWGSSNEQLHIGHYVSIAAGVKFLLGGNHRLDSLSTYPFKVRFIGGVVESFSKGPITIGDDVWIGTDALILSGVTIGQGAVIAARSVVVKDVPPYAIVAGNPAHTIKFRFNQDQRDALLGIDFSKIDRAFVLSNLESLYTPLSEDILIELTKKLRR